MLGFRAAVIIPGSLGVLVCALMAALALSEPGPFGEVAFVAVVLPIFLLIPLLLGSMIAMSCLKSLMENRPGAVRERDRGQ